MGALVIAVLTLATPGCSLLADADPATPPTTAVTTTTEAPASGETAIELLDPGVEPRAALRIRYEVGDEATVALTTELRVDQEVDGRRQVLDSPPITQIVTHRVLEVTDAGAEVAFRIDQVRLDAEGTALTPEAALTLQQDLLQLEGLGGRSTIDATGRATDLVLDERPPLDIALASRLDELLLQLGAAAPVLPEEPVGLGARWRVDQRAERQGRVTERTTTYELTGLTGDGIATTGTTEIRSEEREVDGLVVEPATLAGTVSATTSLTRPTFTFESLVRGEQVVRDLRDDGATLVQQVEVAHTATEVAPAD